MHRGSDLDTSGNPAHSEPLLILRTSTRPGLGDKASVMACIIDTAVFYSIFFGIQHSEGRLKLEITCHASIAIKCFSELLL